MTKKTDQDLFASAMRGTTKLKNTKVTFKPHVIKKPIQRPEPEDKTEFFAFSEVDRYEPVEVNTLLFFARPGPQKNTLRKLRQGECPIDATLDLHGKTVAQARDALSDFLFQCQQHHVQHVLIIHGKGRHNAKPILKNKLNHWLREIDLVLAFSSAISKDGSSGALYVLLRR